MYAIKHPKEKQFDLADEISKLAYNILRNRYYTVMICMVQALTLRNINTSKIFNYFAY